MSYKLYAMYHIQYTAARSSISFILCPDFTVDKSLVSLKKAISLISRNLRYPAHNDFKSLLFAHPCIWYISTTININSLTIKNTKPAYDNVKKSSEMKQMAQSVS